MIHFHVITPRGSVYLCSTDGRRVIIQPPPPAAAPVPPAPDK